MTPLNNINIMDGVAGWWHSIVWTNGTSGTNRVYGWGYNDVGAALTGDSSSAPFAPIPVDATAKVPFDIASGCAGHRFTLLINVDGSIWSAGKGTNGALGNGGSPIEQFSLSLVGVPIFATQVTCGFETAFALTREKKVYVWGQNQFGQLGLGSTGGALLTPVVSPFFNGLNISKLISGYENVHALTESGDVYSWGRNLYGELSMPPNGSPVLIPTKLNMTNVLDIVASTTSYHTLFKFSDGLYYGTGSNVNGELSLNNVTDIFIPRLIPFTIQNNVSHVALGYYSTFMVVNGQMFATGGQTGQALAYPTEIFELGGDNAGLATGATTTLVKKRDNTLWSFGVNTMGGAGLGDQRDRFKPARVGNFGPVTVMATAKDASFFLINQTYLYQMGNNNGNQLSLGGVFPAVVATPTRTLSLPGKITALGGSTFVYHVMGVNGRTYDWGGGITPFTLFGSTYGTGDIIDVQNGYLSQYVLTSEGRIYARGANDAGQLCMNGLPTPYLINSHPNFAPNGVFFTKMAVGERFVYILTPEGKVYSCGASRFGENGHGLDWVNDLYEPRLIPTFASMQVIDIAAGYTHGLFVVNETDSNGTRRDSLWSVGNNQFGALGHSNNVRRLNIPKRIENVTNPKVIEAGWGFSLFIRSCPKNTAGLNCQYNVCFGMSGGNEIQVCSGQGKCVGPNKCECTSHAFGDQCEFGSTFEWKGFTGDWSDPQNWWRRNGDVQVRTLNTPSRLGERALFIAPGTYRVKMDLASISMYGIYVGNDQNVVNLIFDGPIVSLTEIYVHPKSTVEFSNVQSASIGTFTGQGNVIIKNSRINGKVTLASTAFLSFSTFLGEFTVNNNALLETLTFQNCLVTPKGNTTLKSVTMKDSVMIVSGLLTALSPLATGVLTSSFIQLERSNITAKSLFAFSGSMSMVESFITAEKGLILEGNVDGDSRSGFYNLDTFTANLTSPVRFSVNLVNSGTVSLVGYGSITMFSLQQVAGSRLKVESHLILNNPSNITAGEVFLNGKITCPRFEYSSIDGVMEASRSEFYGDLVLTSQATILIRLGGVSKESAKEYIFVNGTAQIDAFILISPGNFEVSLNQRIPFIVANKYQPFSKNILLLGAPQKGAELIETGETTRDLSIKLSYGSVENTGYRCGYLGNQKILEVNDYVAQGKQVLSLTFPRRDDHVTGKVLIGFGFDLNGTISDSMLILINNKTVTSWSHQVSAPLRTPILAEIAQSKSVFTIGADYLTINMIVASGSLLNQKFIYFTEIKNGTLNHTTEVYQNSIFSKNFPMNCTNFLQPTRKEIYDYYGTGFMLITYLVLFVACCVFMRWRPLNTRGIAPLLTIAFLFIQLLLEIRNYFEIPTYQGGLCLYYSFAMYPLQQICFIVILVYFFKYFAVINLNENKKNFYKRRGEVNSGQNTFQKVSIIFLKTLASPWFTISLIVGSYIVIVTIFIIVMAGYGFVCQFDTLLILKTFHNVELLIIYVATLAVLLSDMIPNWRLIVGFKWIDYIFYRDPYWFRAQIILFLPFMLYSLAIEIFVLSATTNYLGIVTHFNTTTILNTIQAQILLIIEVILPLILTWYELIKIGCRRGQKLSNFAVILQTKESRDLFAEFCGIEYSLENLACYEDCVQYRLQAKDAKDPHVIAQTYLTTTSPMEVNVSSVALKTFHENMAKDPRDPETLFLSIEACVRQNLMDTFGRFAYWEKYLEWLRTQQLQLELIEGMSIN